MSEKQLQDKSPKLDGFIDQISTGDGVGKVESFIIIQVSISNIGGSPSIAEDFGLMVRLPGMTLKANPLEFDTDYDLSVLKDNTTNRLKISRSDVLSEKTAKAIQPGESPRGWMAFTLPGIQISQFGQTNVELVLSFSDIIGNRVSVTNGYWKGRKSQGMEWGRTEPRRLPGSGTLKP
jgi:hypothetical protein